MAQRRPIPDHWRTIMDRRGISSIRQLADRAGLSHPTIIDLMHGDKRGPTPETLHRVARALNIPLRDAYYLAGIPSELPEIWEPPAEADLLNKQQRAVLVRIIRLMVAKEDDENFDSLQRQRRAAIDELRRVFNAAEPESIHDNVHQLHPERDGLDLAAHKGHGLSAGQLNWDAGEESQDD